jgi:NCAIR mutase (PurE)-related protein
MDNNYLKNLLKKVQGGQIDIDQAMHQLKKLPYEDLGYARVDLHRCMRSGVPEVIYCEGKTIAQIQGIAARLAQHHTNILGTRADHHVFEKKKRPSITVNIMKPPGLWLSICDRWSRSATLPWYALELPIFPSPKKPP